ncbi:MAG: hypothetical protein N2049_09965 [Anaerolineales bacterium]|nr:hypothetical protein [Anaerolineales bacterium]
MQTCSKCNAISPDMATHCVQCQADLREFSLTAVSLKRMQANPRVKAVRISVADDACPYCYELLRTYPKDAVPPLPHLGCSHEHGCRCFYEPVLSEAAVIGKVVK